MTLLELLLLYLAFRAKQVICDYFLQTGWMASAMASPRDVGGTRALVLHAGIHAAFTFMLVVLFAPSMWWLGLADFFIHGAIDRFKAEVNLRHGWTHKDTRFWWAFGLEQEAHNITHLVYIILILWHNGWIACAS